MLESKNAAVTEKNSNQWQKCKLKMLQQEIKEEKMQQVAKKKKEA